MVQSISRHKNQIICWYIYIYFLLKLLFPLSNISLHIKFKIVFVGNHRWNGFLRFNNFIRPNLRINIHVGDFKCLHNLFENQNNTSCCLLPHVMLTSQWSNVSDNVYHGSPTVTMEWPKPIQKLGDTHVYYVVESQWKHVLCFVYFVFYCWICNIWSHLYETCFPLK